MGAHESRPVAAIDFGTTHTGYAYSFQGPEAHNIITGRDELTNEHDRVPTTVLLNPDKTFHSFGFKAEDDYYRLTNRDQQRYYFFREFKMVLYQGQTLTRHTVIRDEHEKPMKVMALFKTVLNHIKSQVIESMKNRLVRTDNDFQERNIDWMITIPAIWTDHARQFMREAVEHVGIPRGKLHLVLEPEAASLYCLNKITVSNKGLPVGFKYILADLGGGTADICVHEITADGNLREIHSAIGGNLGGSRVDFEFTNFMIELVSKKVWREFESRYTTNYLKFINNFLQEKCKFSMNTEEVMLPLEYPLIDLLKKDGKTFEDIIKGSRFNNHLNFDSERLMLLLKAEVMARFFNPSMQGIINLLNEILCNIQNIETILLVGGYGESKYLREKLRCSVQSIVKVVLEPDARLAVLKGAVMMGYHPRNIVQRRARFSYGFSVSDPFIEGVHPQALKTIRDGEILCTNVFKKLIEKDQIITYGQKFRHGTSNPVRKKESKMLVFHPTLYKSASKYPQFCTEDDCDVIGEVVIRPPRDGWGYINTVYLDYFLIVDENEIYAKVYDKSTNRVFVKHFDLLEPL